MNKKYINIIASALAALTFCACSDDYTELKGWTASMDGSYLMLSDASSSMAEGLHFRYAGGTSGAINFDAESAVSAECSANWLSVNMLSDKSATITASPNESNGARSADVTFRLAEKQGSPSVTIKVTQSGAVNVLPKNLTIEGLQFNLVKGGTFMMGATEEQTVAFQNENPAHTVTVSDCYFATTEVTQELWYNVMGSYPGPNGAQASKPLNGTNLPACYVNYDDCQEFIGKLQEKSGYPLRMPTEAEWEYAARGGAQQLYAGSNDVNEVAWYTGNAKAVNAVGKKKANAFGLYDMSGNVWEWCSDYYSASYYSESNNATNPMGPTSGGTYHVVRGGGWHADATYCRVSNRDYALRDSRTKVLGLRLVAGAPKIKKEYTLSFANGYKQKVKVSIGADELSRALGLSKELIDAAFKDGRGKILPAAPDFKIGNNNTEGKFGGWFDDKNTPCMWADNGGHVYIEVFDDIYNWNCGIHAENNVCAIGDEHIVNMLYQIYSSRYGWRYVDVEVTFIIGK